MRRALCAAAVLLALVGCADPGFEAALAQAEANAAAARAREVDALYAFIRKTHPAPFHHNAQQRIEAELAQLQANAARMSWPEYVVGVARVLKLVGDAETTLVLPGSGPGFDARLPIEVDAFGDGWFVTHAADSEVIGARVRAIEGKPIDEVFAALAPCWPHENAMWVKRAAPELLRIPAFLAGCGISRGRDVNSAIALEVALPAGRERTIEVKPVVGATRRTARSIVPEAPAPSCGVMRLPRGGAIYVNTAECDGARAAALAAELAPILAGFGTSRLVIDVRRSASANATWEPLLRAISASPLNRPGALFALTGRDTVAASMRLATQLERNTQVLFVGEPTGSAPNHFGAAKSIALPASKLGVLVATARFEDSDSADTRFTLEPDLPAWQKLEDWRTGRDAALEAALRYRAAADAQPFDPRERWRTPRRRERVQ